MKSLFIILLSILFPEFATAIPAYPGVIPISIDGKTVHIRMFGDEHNKRAETLDGYTIIQDSNSKWWYAEKHPDGYLIPSKYALKADFTHEKELQDFLSNTPTHLKAHRSVQPTELKAGKSANVTGERRILIILMEYPDLNYTKTKGQYEDLFNEIGYHEDGALGSVKDFFNAASYGQLNLTSDIYGPYMSEHNMAFYGRNDIQGNDSNPYALFMEAIGNVANETDLSQYDMDEDGVIDNVHIIFAGYGEEAGAQANAIWSHEMSFGSYYEIQGMKIDKYSCAPELRGNSGGGISRIGPHCHEIGHALGAMDFYDTNYDTDGRYEGTGKWDIMAAGSWNNDGISPADFNPYVKAFNYGWVQPQALPEGNITISPSHTGSDNYYILQPSEESDFYLIENRSKTGWGVGLPGEGLLIFHIHQDIEQAGNKINATNPQKCYVVCASSQHKKPNNPNSYGDINSAGCPYPGSANKSEFSLTSTPMAFYWTGEECSINITNITLLPNGEITLINASSGTGYVPIETEQLLFEGFEGNILVNIQDDGWQIVSNPTNPTMHVNYPLAYEGSNSLQLSAAKSIFEPKNGTLDFSFSPINNTGKLTLSLYYSSKGITNTPNTIIVKYMLQGQEEWQQHTIVSSRNTIWENYKVILPNQIIPSIYMDGTAVPGSTLAIDNIEIEQEKPNGTSISSTLHHSIGYNDNYYYTLDGRRHSSPQHGINIQRMSDGTYRKIWIK